MTRVLSRMSGILYDWALYAGALGDLDLAARCHDEHLRVLGEVRDDVARSLRAMGLRTRAYVAWLAGQFESARDFLGASAELARSLEDERGSQFHLSRALALSAMVAHDAGDDDESARALAETARIECAKRGWVGHVAHAHTVLGLASVGEDPTAARAHLEHAMPWVSASNEVEMALRCHHLATEVARAEGRVGHVAISEATALALIATHGLVRFARCFRAADQNS